MLGKRLTDQQVAAFARLALDGIGREYPNKPSNVMVGPQSVRSPREMHPAFYGCFDWHSSVHGHWMLVRLLKMYPGSSVAREAKERLSEHLTADNLEAEAAYFKMDHNKSFERMYGWAWALRLAGELSSWDDPLAKEWAAAYKPLEEVIVEHTKKYLPKLDWPVRTGVHPDTAFALAQILDYSRLVDDRELEALIVGRSRDFYINDTTYPIGYEPSGEDFFSSGLNEADLMRRVLRREDYSRWLDGFFPSLHDGRLGNLLEPVRVADTRDGKIVHLAGLNLSRAWTMRGIARKLSPKDRRKDVLERAARLHTESGLDYVFSGHYEGEHWLATFAIYLLTDVGLEDNERRR